MAYNEPLNRGTPDSDLEFCSAQSIPTDGADDISENLIDLQNTAPRLLNGARAKLKVQVTTAITVASGTSSLLNLNLTCAATETTVGAQTTVATAVIQLGDAESAGQIYEAALPERVPVNLTRYLALVLEPVSDDTLYSAGAIDAWIDFD